MIKIHTGLLENELLPPKPENSNVETVENRNDYVLIRQYIQQALRNQESLIIYILTPICRDWFWDLATYSPHIKIIDDSPTERLKRKLKINTLPIDLIGKQEIIIELNLLDLPTPTDWNLAIWDWIIEHKLGEVWLSQQPSWQHLSDLIKWYLKLSIPLSLQAKTKELSVQWLTKSNGLMREAYEYILGEPEINAYVVATWQALAKYPANRRDNWLKNEGWNIDSLNQWGGYLTPLNYLPYSIQQKFDTYLKTYWQTHLRDITYE